MAAILKIELGKLVWLLFSRLHWGSWCGCYSQDCIGEACVAAIELGKSTTWESDNEVEDKDLLMLRFYSDRQFFVVVYLRLLQVQFLLVLYKTFLAGHSELQMFVVIRKH